MIRFEGVSKLYVRPGGPPVHAVRDLALEVRRGETLCLIGASGSGKTTALRLVNRLLEPSAGTVRVDGRDVATLDPVALRRSMGYVVQSGALFPHLTVAENVGLLCKLAGQTRERVRARVEELLELVHLAPRDFAARFPSELSGGERQRVGVARALALDPEVLLMDEPFGALDPITRGQVQRELQELLRRVEKTVVVVTHDLDEAFLLGDRVGLMAEGRLEQVGTREELRDAPASDRVRRFLEGHLRVD